MLYTADDDSTILLNLRIINISKMDLSSLLEKGLSQIAKVTEKSYSMIILPSDNLNVPLYELGSIYAKLPRHVRKNLSKLYILEPSLSVRLYLNILSFIASPKFFKKIRWVNDQFVAPYFYTFGVDLEKVMKYPFILPRVVTDSITVISRHLNVVGLFRMSPSLKVLNRVKKSYDDGNPGDLSLDLLDDVNLACSMLKMFVRELPKAIFDVSFYQEFKELPGNFKYQLILVNQESQVISSIQDKILQRMTKSEFILFQAIMEILHKVHLNAEYNKMDTKNLILVWAPNLVHTPREEYDHFKRNIMVGLSLMLKYCIENYKIIFQS